MSGFHILSAVADERSHRSQLLGARKLPVKGLRFGWSSIGAVLGVPLRRAREE